MKYDPWDDARERYPDVHIDWRTHIEPFHGMWVPEQRVILIRKGLTRAEGRCALAHELAHIDTGDDPTDMCWFADRQETAADKLAARRLISIDELAAVMLWTSNAGEAAEALDVTPAMLHIRATAMAEGEHDVLLAARARREMVA